MFQEKEIRISEKTRKQMERFKEWVISPDSRELSLADKGILYTLIGMADSGYTIGQVEEYVPDSNKSVHRHLRNLEARGFVTLIPVGVGKQITGMHYRVNL